MTQPHNPRPAHPAWCFKDGESAIGRHVSQVHKVGDRSKGGIASVWLTAIGTGPPRMHVSVAQMAWATIDIPLKDAVLLRDALTELLKSAVYKPGSTATDGSQR